MLYLGVVFAYSVGLIIVAHISKNHFPYWNITFLPLIIGLLDVYFTPSLRTYPPHDQRHG